VPITGHARRLEQAVLNLVGNAIKYTPEGGAVSVTASRSPDGGASGGTATLAVRDSGIGIPARDLPYVFDRFYRVRSDATQHIAGTGLGLAIVKGIAEAHGGRVSVESTEGAGSTFCLELPAPAG
jgi:signal transduction histidine kinase